MTKAKSVLDVDFDIVEHRKQAAKLKEVANKTVATKVEEIKTLLRSIHSICKEADIFVDIRGINSEIEELGSMHPDWNSSSYDC